MIRPMHSIVRLAVVLLPALGLAALWGQSHQTYNTGTEWEVPIMGYDPRDILRGHYVEFTYDWPLAGDADESGLMYLCLSGDAPRLVRATPVASAAELAACPHPLRAEADHIYGMTSLERGRLYLDQYKAAMVDAQLRDTEQRGIVTIRQREDGSFTPVAIRFRPLTPGERAARDAPGEERPVPAIMEAP
ncbi:MAG: GDYXXLXY domain-containing protein [Erythrobacter sp.]|jgi:hypothetical protein|nr:GDYXXLXY domain-containing protein [Erythrobacter sp.]